ncbi:MAG: cbb3-type cytochrome oxidase assembly protein CcoS [Steroidobacteraceae bacterium]|jgi:cbb3-type cytochrome oxidase maturation protein|nr:cbb3-type cytochrome oxidase assembly protein CcoS [Steroidobacteraceae bacterium]
MESLYLLIPLSILLVVAAVWAFFWAVNQGQFEDLDEPARSILEEDGPTAAPGAPQSRGSRAASTH